MTTASITPNDLRELDAARKKLRRGDGATQAELDALVERWQPHRESLRPGEADEAFALVDTEGGLTSLSAPRWLCHLLGLRHRCVHVLLMWLSPGLGHVFVFQVRSWTKNDAPGQLDISAAGHNKDDDGSDQTAYDEMCEELGLTRTDLEDRALAYRDGYESYNELVDANFYNSQWCEVYVGEIVPSGLERIHFRDSEVVGVYLCPVEQASNLLEQDTLRIANALKNTLPRLLAAMECE